MVRSLQAGASDFVAKDSLPGGLIDAIRKILNLKNKPELNFPPKPNRLPVVDSLHLIHSHIYFPRFTNN
jgi:hypothetical protein